MNKVVCAALLALVAVAPARAEGLGIFPPCKIECGANCYFRVVSPVTAQCGPWYLYWPLDAHFQTPGNPCYPYWPAPMGLPQTVPPYTPGVPPMTPAGPGDGKAPAGPNLPAPTPTPKAPDVKPIGYQVPAYPAPAYWYPH